MPIHDGGSGGNTKLVGRADHRDPVACGDTAWRDDVAYTIVQNLGRRSRQRPEPHVFESHQIIFDAPVREGRAIQNLLGRKRVHVNLRDFSLDSRAKVDVERSMDPRRQAGLNADLGSAEIPSLPNPPENFIEGQKVTLLRSVAAAEGAEAASLHADIREIDVAVDDVGDPLAYPAPPPFVSRGKQPAQIISFRGEER